MAGMFLYEVEAKVNPSEVVSKAKDAIKAGVEEAPAARLHYLFQVGLFKKYY